MPDNSLKKTSYKLIGFSIVLCVVLSGAYSHAGGQGTRKGDAIITSPMDYQDSLNTFKTITEGMTQQEVADRLGPPDRVIQGDPDQTWFDESWTYDFRKLAGYPKTDNRRAVWEGTSMFLNRKVVHTRLIGWLE